MASRCPDAHGAAVLALATIDALDGPDALPALVSASMDKTVATWTLLDEPSPSSSSFARQAQFGADDAPWWCLDASDDDYLYAGTHARAVVARLTSDPDLPPLPGAVANHTGWVRALASVAKTQEEVDAAGERFGARWRFSAACNVVRVWQDAFDGSDEDGDEGESEETFDNDASDASESSSEPPALADVGSAKLFSGDILALAAAEIDDTAASSGVSRRAIFAGVADGTVREWTVEPSARDRFNAPRLTLRDPPNDAPPVMEGRVACLHATTKASRGARAAPRSDEKNTAVSSSSFALVAGCLGGSLRAWTDPESVSNAASASARVDGAHPGGVRALCDGPGGTVCSAGEDGAVRVWRIEEGARGDDDSGGETREKHVVRPPGGVGESAPPRGVPALAEVASVSACRGVAARSMCAVRRGGEVVGVVVGDAVGGLAFVEFGFF